MAVLSWSSCGDTDGDAVSTGSSARIAGSLVSCDGSSPLDTVGDSLAPARGVWSDETVSAAASPTISRMRSSRRRSGEVFGSEWGSVVSVAPSSSVSAAAVATSQSMLVVGDGEGGVRAGSAAGAEDELDADVVGDVAEVGEEWPSGLGRLPLPVTDAVRDVSCAAASEVTAADPAGVGAAVCEGAHSCAAGRWSGRGFDPAVATGATSGDWLVFGTGEASGRTGVALRTSGLHRHCPPLPWALVALEELAEVSW